MLLTLLLQFQATEIDKVLDDPALRHAVIGACVLDISGKELYARNADLRLLPASNQKVLTAAYALNKLGPDYKPVTRFWRQKSAIVIDATGDPLMTYDKLLDLKQRLKGGKGVKVKLRSAYGPLYPIGWEWDDLRNKYAAPVSAFTVDRSSFELWTDKGRLFYQPANYGAKAFWKAGTDDLRIDFDPRTMMTVVTGPPPQGPKRLDTLAIGRPDRAAASLLGSKFERIQEVPNTPPDLTYSGDAVSAIVREDLPSSDNNIAENLFLMASGVRAEDTDPYGVAQERMAAFLTEIVGLDPTEFKAVDGSGLSRHNVITARAIAKLLIWADSQPTKQLWRSCLAHPGEGTLRTRLEGVPFEGKTGSMDMVNTLCGYLKLNDGTDIVAAIMVNGQAISTAETRDLVDLFMRKVLEAGNGGTLYAESQKHEGTRPDPRTGPSPFHRVSRSHLDGRAAPARTHPRDESSHAGLHRAERVALRAR